MLTLILPVRDWATERVEACLRSFVALDAPSVTEILIVDFGSREPVAIPDNISPMIRTLRLEAKVWSLAEAINAGVMVASNSLIAKTDADILISPQSRDEFERMAALISSGSAGLGVCQATDLHQSLGVEDALTAVLAGEAPLGRLRAKWGQGGLVFFSRDLWDAIGGFDSRFTGWGNEDNDFAERVRRFGRSIHWADQDELQIFHVWHPPTHAVTGIAAQRQKNEAIAKGDRSVLRSVSFRHSNFAKIAAPAVLRSAAPLVTLGVATTARPGRDRMLREAIDSFRGQIDHDFEILVVDNGSSDEDVANLRTSLDKIRWANGLMRLEATPRPSIPGARNIVTAEARGRYICVVDDDDMAFSNRLADHLRNFEKDGQLHGSHGGWIDFDESTGVIERNGGKSRTAASLLFASGKKTAHPSCFYRTDVLRAIPYDEAFALGSDLDLALRMATLGLEIGHTGSYVTLRRFHSTNVTLTGTSNQASNGAAAKARAIATYSWNTISNLEKIGKAEDAEIYCRNQMSLDTLTALMPDYTGEWHIFVPIEDLTASVEPRQLFEDHADYDLIADTGTALTPAALPLDPGLMQKLGDIVDGTFCTRRSGINQPTFFRSEPIKTIRKASKVQQQVESLLGRPVQIGSVRQAEIDRALPFREWTALPIGSGERRLRSAAFGSMGELMMETRGIDRNSLIGATMQIVSDFDEHEGEQYFLVTPPVRGHDDIACLQHNLSSQGIEFFQIAGNGVHAEITMGGRSH